MIIPVVIGAIVLGRSFDMKDASPKNTYIFDQEELKNNIQDIPRTFTKSQYRLIESSSDSSDLLDVDGDFTLKVKNGKFGLQGYGSYLTSTINREKTVEMLITVYHETKTVTFPSYSKLRTDWQGKAQHKVGTHYVRSITYGGQLIISYQLKATKEEYMEEIEAAVKGSLAISGSFDGDIKGKLEMLNERVSDKSTVTITASATTGLFSPPTTLEDCLQLVKDYPQKVRDVNNGTGAPLKIELVELATLQSNYSSYLKNYALDGMLNSAINKYDDIRVAWNDYTTWEDQNTQLWPEDVDEQINEYQRKLKKAKSEMSTAIANLDATGDLDQFDAAFKAYGEGKDNMPNKYTRELKRIIHLAEQKPFYWFPYTKAVSHYVHWGSTNCSLPSSAPVYVGYAATSPNVLGNGGSIECLRAHNPSLEERTLSNDTAVSQITGLFYEYPNEQSGQVFCAFCKLENATAVYAIAGRTECPEHMKLEYSGFLTAGRGTDSPTSLVCLDSHPDTHIPGETASGAIGDAGKLVPTWVVCPECDEDENRKYVSCVVCSR